MTLKVGDVVRIYENDFLLPENQLWQPGHIVPMEIVSIDPETDHVLLSIERTTQMKLSDLQRMLDARREKKDAAAKTNQVT